MTILWPSLVISGFSRGHLVPCWPPHGHLGSILRHFSVMNSEDRRCVADFAKCVWRLHESAILSILALSWDHLGAIFGPSRAILGPSWLILGPLRATLGPFGPFGERTHDGVANLAKFALRLHETPILGSP